MKSSPQVTQLTGVTPTPLKLSVFNYWQEIEVLIEQRTLPQELGTCLRSLISSHVHKTIPPEAKPHLVTYASVYLPDGIEFSGVAGHEMCGLYDVMVFVPDFGKELKLRAFFYLVRKWPGGQLKYSRDV